MPITSRRPLPRGAKGTGSRRRAMAIFGWQTGRSLSYLSFRNNRSVSLGQARLTHICGAHHLPPCPPTAHAHISPRCGACGKDDPQLSVWEVSPTQPSLQRASSLSRAAPTRRRKEGWRTLAAYQQLRGAAARTAKPPASGHFRRRSKSAGRQLALGCACPKLTAAPQRLQAFPQAACQAAELWKAWSSAIFRDGPTLHRRGGLVSSTAPGRGTAGDRG